MTIEIVDFPIENGGSFHSYVTVYQRVTDFLVPSAIANSTLQVLSACEGRLTSDGPMMALKILGLSHLINLEGGHFYCGYMGDTLW